MIDVSKIAPTRSLLLLDTTPEEETTAAGVIIPVMPDKAKKTPKAKGGRIVAVGPDVDAPGKHIDRKGNHYFHAPGLVVGARVMVRQYADEHFFSNQRRYHYAEASEVLGIIHE